MTGASRGFGRAIAVAPHDAGARVVAVARDAERLAELRDEYLDKLGPGPSRSAGTSPTSPRRPSTFPARTS